MQIQLQSTSCSRRVLRTSAGGCMKVQTCGHTWEGACAEEERTKNTKQPALSGPFLSACAAEESTKNTSNLLCPDAFARILDGTHELWCSHIKNTRIHRQLSLFLVPRAVRGTAFSHTLKHMPDLLVIETRILVH